MISYRLRHIAPLLALIASTVAIFIMFRYTPVWYVNPPTFTIIMLATGLSGLTIIARRRLGGWTLLASGLVSILLAISIIYARTLSENQGWTRWRYETVTDLIRAMLVSGGIFVLLGLTQSWVDVLTDRDQEASDG